MPPRLKTSPDQSLPPMFTPLTYAQLLQFAHRSNAITQSCSCKPKAFVGWEGLPAWIKEGRLREVGSLIAAEEEDLTLDEYHPAGTSYWSSALRSHRSSSLTTAARFANAWTATASICVMPRLGRTTSNSEFAASIRR
jgi:hypothetical protein